MRALSTTNTTSRSGRVPARTRAAGPSGPAARARPVVAGPHSAGRAAAAARSAAVGAVADPTPTRRGPPPSAASTLRSDNPPSAGTVGPDVSLVQWEALAHSLSPRMRALSHALLCFPFLSSQGIVDVVVVGAGISGLVTAQALLTDHADTVGR